MSVRTVSVREGRRLARSISVGPHILTADKPEPISTIGDPHLGNCSWPRSGRAPPWRSAHMRAGTGGSSTKSMSGLVTSVSREMAVPSRARRRSGEGSVAAGDNGASDARPGRTKGAGVRTAEQRDLPPSMPFRP